MPKLIILPSNIYQFTLMDFFLSIPRDLYMHIFAADQRNPTVPSPYQESILEHHRATLSKIEFKILQEMSPALLSVMCQFHPVKWAPAFDYVSIEDVLSLSMLGTHRVNMSALRALSPELDLEYGSNTYKRWQLTGTPSRRPLFTASKKETPKGGIQHANHWLLVAQWCQKLSVLTTKLTNLCKLDGRNRDGDRIQRYTNKVQALKTAIQKAFQSGKVEGSGLPMKFAEFQKQILQSTTNDAQYYLPQLKFPAQSIWSTKQAVLEVHRKNHFIDYIRVQPSTR